MRDMEWISVKERLPETSVPVVGYRDLIQTYSIVMYTTAKRWMFYYDAGWAGEITHWMPLPPPPAREGEL